MKRRKALSLLLSLAIVLSLVLPVTTAFAADGEPNDGGDSNGNGMHVSKTALYDENDGSYTIKLEAYATGNDSTTTSTEEVPTDIILVLDQSGSMKNCLVCGKEINGNNQTHTVYSETTTISISQTYYIKNGNSYTQVAYCNGNHSFMGYEWNCDGGAGWYTSDWSSDHTQNTKITPKTEDNPDGTQFYTSTSTTERCSSRRSALITAVNSFVTDVNSRAKGKDGIYDTADDINHRIAVVGFASQSGYGNNTELLSIRGNNSGSVGVAYGSISDQNLIDVMQDMDTAAGMTMVTNAINALDANGATRTDLGLDMAERILNANPLQEGEKRNRVVIVFSDGSPTSSSSFEEGVANNAITKASSIKAAGTTIYSIGVFSGADASQDGDKGGSETQKANWFMHRISSNKSFPQSPSYYLSANSHDALNNIFTQISSQIQEGTSSALKKESIVKDIISPYFALPEGASVSSITLETYKYNGPNADWTNNNNAMGATASLNESKDQVNVTGFDFAENYVADIMQNGTVTGYRGNKLVISFKVWPKAGFLGGNSVVTNTSAGIYEDGNAEEPYVTFEQPKVDVAIGEVKVTATDKNVYLLGGVTAGQIKSGTITTVNGIELKLGEENFGLESWQNQYVDITVEITDGDGKLITAFSGLTNDTTYTIKVTVAPKPEYSTPSGIGKPATKQENSATRPVNVFKPVLTYKDSEAYYGDNAPTDYSGNLVSTEWKHDETLSTTVTMTGDEPTLGMTYTPEAGKINSLNKIDTKEDIGVDVAVTVNSNEVESSLITFVHQDCEGKTCTLPEGKFLVHVKTCTLTITKTGGAANESYVFDVYKDGNKYSEVAIWGNNSQVIYELPVGTYTIAENTGWSWRYDGDNGGNGVKLDKDHPTGVILCTNTSNGKTLWLNGFSTIVPNIFGQASTPATDTTGNN